MASETTRRHQLRRDLRSQAVEKVDALLLEGVKSGPLQALNDRFWRKLRAEATKRSSFDHRD